jgi:hypothetical protein
LSIDNFEHVLPLRFAFRTAWLSIRLLVIDEPKFSFQLRYVPSLVARIANHIEYRRNGGPWQRTFTILVSMATVTRL